MDYFCSVHGLQFNLSSMWALVSFIYLFIPEKDHRLATIPSLFSMYSTGTSLSAQIMRPVWPAQSWSVMSGSFQVRDRDRGTLEIQVNFCSARLLDDSPRPSQRVEPRELLFIFCFIFLSHLRLGLRLWCIWAQSRPTATKSSLWSIQHKCLR